MEKLLLLREDSKSKIEVKEIDIKPRRVKDSD